MSATIALLHPGDMGLSLGRRLVAQGHRVVTCAEGRSARTLEGAKQFEMLPTLGQLVHRADLVLSLVTPSAAVAVARSVAPHLAALPSPPIYLDANAIEPRETHEIARAMEAARTPFVDGCVLGTAQQPAGITLYVSGPQRARATAMLVPPLDVRDLGEPIGRASAFKLAFSGLLKSSAALLFELGVAGERQGILDELLRAYDELPSLGVFFRQVLGSYVAHAPRRAEELDLTARHQRSLGLSSDMVEAAASTIERVARADLAQLTTGHAQPLKVDELIRALASTEVFDEPAK